MTIRELADMIGATVETGAVDTDRDVTCGYACDLLSWVMSRGREGMAWVTVQAHMNAVAVAVLADMSCVIAAEGVRFDEAVVKKADDEGVALLASDKSAYEIAGMMYEKGIR
jgi:hypothetical protein